MAGRNLRELLREEQEPFVLKSYIEERRSHFRRWPPPPRTHLHSKRPQPISQNMDVTSTPPKSSLFSPFNSSDAKGSWLLDFPGRTPLSARKATAQMLLQAALRIHENTEMPKNRKAKGSVKDLGFGFFASVLKRLVLRRWRCEIEAKEMRISAREVSRRSPSSTGVCGQDAQVAVCVQEKHFLEMHRSSYSERRIETEKNHLKVDNAMGSSFCELEPGSSEKRVSACGVIHDECASTPSTPPQIVPSDEIASPEVVSPAGSPRRLEIEQSQRQLFGGTADDGRSKAAEKEYDEEEKEQFSPVSVLDPLFHEDDEDHCDAHVEQYQRSLALVQRAKQQVLHQIRRFERLAEMDPVELDRLLAEKDDVNVDGSEEIDDSCHQCLDFDELLPELVQEIIIGSNGCCCDRRIPRLVSDLVQEEKGAGITNEMEGQLAQRVIGRFEAWKAVGSNTIDMMVESEFRREGKEWKSHDEHVQAAAAHIELAIFELLVLELSSELVPSLMDHHDELASLVH